MYMHTTVVELCVTVIQHEHALCTTHACVACRHELNIRRERSLSLPSHSQSLPHLSLSLFRFFASILRLSTTAVVREHLEKHRAFCARVLQSSLFDRHFHSPFSEGVSGNIQAVYIDSRQGIRTVSMYLAPDTRK